MKMKDERDLIEQQMIRPEVLKTMQQSADKHTKAPIITENRRIMLLVMREHIINSIFWNVLIDMIESEIKRQGFQFTLNVVDTEEAVPLDQADSFIMLGNIPVNYGHLIADMKKPFVWVDGDNKYGNYSQVRVNNCYGAYQITKRAIELGHRHLAYVRTNSHLSYIERSQGMMECVEEYSDLGVHCEMFEVNQEREADIFTQLLTRKDRPTFILTCTDPVAYSLFAIAQQLMIDVPGSLSVAGFDNMHESRHMSPPLSSVDVPRVDMAVIAVQQLVKHMYNPLSPHELIQVEPTVVFRESLAAYNSAVL